jgi:hypothetical protein
MTNSHLEESFIYNLFPGPLNPRFTLKLLNGMMTPKLINNNLSHNYLLYVKIYKAVTGISLQVILITSILNNTLLGKMPF